MLTEIEELVDRFATNAMFFSNLTFNFSREREYRFAEGLLATSRSCHRGTQCAGLTL